MTIRNLLEEARKFEIQTYKRPHDLGRLRETHVSFSGALMRHPYSRNKIILVSDPHSANTSYFEFRKDDVSYLQELPSVVDEDGEAIPMSRIWVKKQSIGVRCSPFVVEDIGVNIR